MSEVEKIKQQLKQARLKEKSELPLTKEQLNHFMAGIEKRGNVRIDMSPCWLWIRCFTSAGYGDIKVNGIRWNSHRLSYWIHSNYKKLERKDIVRHKCDNKQCCNPEHLELGTHRENMEDVFTRGIRKKAEVIEKQTKYGHNMGKQFTKEQMSGENNTTAKLSWEDVREIRRKNKEEKKYGLLKELATKYEVSYTTITKIISNQLWKE